MKTALQSVKWVFDSPSSQQCDTATENYIAQLNHDESESLLTHMWKKKSLSLLQFN